MSELSDALHQLADALARGEVLPNAQHAALVCHDMMDRVSVTYIGRSVPPNLAGMNLLTMGMQHGITKLVEASSPMSLTRGSTH